MSEKNLTQLADARPIPGRPGYLVRDGGAVYSCWSQDCKGEMTDRWHLKVPRKHKHAEHMQIRLKTGDKHKLYSVHRIVLEAFVGPCPPGMECCHNDGNPKNNFLSNLRWDTRESNTEDRYKHGRITRGVDTNTAKLTDADIPEIFRKFKQGVKQKELAELYGVTQANVSYILKRKSWTHVAISDDLLDIRLGIQGGERAPKAKLKDVDIPEIFRMSRSGLSQGVIARRFGVSQSSISLILLRKKWSHVPV